MKISTDDKKQEAIERMKKIGLFPEVIQQFKDDNRINASLPPYGACYWLDADLQEKVKEYEDDTGALVYHVIQGQYLLGGSDIMEMDAFFYVSDYLEDWEMERQGLNDPSNLYACCYVYNATDPMLSEPGDIGFKLGAAGGLIRTW